MKNTHNTDCINYRIDISGLRGIAVLAVLFYHTDISLFSGGYVGVDIFFVISGFLITNQLNYELEKKHTIDLQSFFLRRIRRLLPAFIFITLITSIFSFLIFTPSELRIYGASLVHASLSISNLYFYSESGYFNNDSKLNPLLHTWTLAVEEQFYIFWPLFLFLMAFRKNIIPIIALIMAAISLYASQKMVIEHNQAVFYLMPFRVFEFLIGASLVWLPKIKINSKIFNNIVFTLGLILIIYSIVNYNSQTIFPGFSALLPCLGAALCLYTGTTASARIILSNSIFEKIGLISYSLYLAHWPIIVFYKRYTGTAYLNSLEAILIIAMSTILALCMYLFIEKPFRNFKQKNHSFLIVVIISLFLSIYIGSSMWATEGWGWRSWVSKEIISTKVVKIGKEARFQIRKKLCELKGWDTCDKVVTGQINALIIGDSLAPDALNAFEKIFSNHNFSMSTLGGCPPHPDIFKITPASHPDRSECKTLNDKRYNEDYLKQFDYIVINLLYGWYKEEDLINYLKYLNSKKIKKVIVFGDYLKLTRNMDELINQFGYNEALIRDHIENPFIDEVSFSSRVKNEGYYFLSKKEVFCLGTCEIFDNNKVPFTYDKFHLSYEFASRISLKYTESINSYLNLSNYIDQGDNDSVK